MLIFLLKTKALTNHSKESLTKNPVFDNQIKEKSTISETVLTERKYEIKGQDIDLTLSNTLRISIMHEAKEMKSQCCHKKMI